MDLSRWIRLHWDRTSAFVFVVAGAVALIVGWIGVSGNGFPAGQLPYVISGGVGGVFLLGLGVALWISADLRDEWLKLDEIERKHDELLAALAAGQAPGLPQQLDDASPKPELNGTSDGGRGRRVAAASKLTTTTGGDAHLPAGSSTAAARRPAAGGARRTRNRAGQP